jgi:hypothetical protein
MWKNHGFRLASRLGFSSDTGFRRAKPKKDASFRRSIDVSQVNVP